MAHQTFRDYINVHEKSYTLPGYSANICGTKKCKIEISHVRQNECFFLEPAHNGISPVTSQSSHGNESDWFSDIVEFTDIGQTGKRSFLESVMLSFRSTAKAGNLNISPDYIRIRAKIDNSEINISNGLYGEIICLRTGEMPFLMRPGTFIMCDKNVIIDTQPIIGSRNAFYIQQLGYNGFLKITGSGGLCFLQGGPTVSIIELAAGETYSCNPECLMGMSESVCISGVDYLSSDPAVRQRLGNEYAFFLKADQRGGLICESEMPIELSGKRAE